MRLDGLRRRIDELDLKLVELLNERAWLSLQIVQEKQAFGLPLKVPDREEEVLNNVAAHNPGPLDGEAICRIFRTIMAECLKLEEVACGDRGDEAGRDPGADRGCEQKTG